MFFYDFEMLDTFIDSNLISCIRTEEEQILKIHNIYNLKKENLTNILTNFVNLTNFINDNKIKDFSNIINSLKESFEKLENICNYSNNLKDTLKFIISLYDKNIENNYNEIKAELIEYNKKSDQLYSIIFEFEDSFAKIISTALTISPYSDQINIESKNKFKVKNDIEVNRHDNNILIISEKDQKAYLPYSFNTVKSIFDNSKNNYETMQDVIQDLYILPLNNFKSSAISRFREAFKLMREKENSSIPKALDLALELIFKDNLNPIIIAACRNIDELDIYLDCLDKNETNEFKCFEIKFEMYPKK